MIIKHAEARQTGTLHKVEGLPCQDAAGFYENDEVAVIVLADGAGSVDHSEIASETVVFQMPSFIADHFDTLFSDDEAALKTKVLDAAETFVRIEDKNMHAYCTFLCVAIHKKSRKSILMHLGDGMILGIDNMEHPWVNESICFPENGEETNLTYFLYGNNAPKHLRIMRFNNDINKMYLLCSDGVSSSLYNFTDKKPANALNVFYGWIKNHDENISYMIDRELDELFRNNSNDDMSIAVLYADNQEE